jgi:Domain of unknown function (DUF3291)
MIASVTEIRVKGIVGLSRFLLYLARIRRQLKHAQGLVAVDYHSWKTLTVWEDAQAMERFRNSGAHLQAMKNTRRIGRANVTSWEVAQVPRWEEAIGRLNESKAQAGRQER